MLHRDNGHLRPYGLVMSKVLCTQSVIHTYLLEAEQKDCTRKKETAKKNEASKMSSVIASACKKRFKIH
ncbi:uncharacterized protein PHALS_07000 [Plasmopara halstedii]|uniref:Uncharacterized protein n=1 Tax=Plasmopara halstedii TaxID=4781 RepID=A0A0P1B4Y3_PLAHL|nr:uncharacterized protein PHALS_07000 [Plasmopara halstedii]CEG49228.1 hypothetical protein PHALS_07000 [Plasmopara halstedii]|eukprot:XP_024585597.1 hypothetical protein PHALS_07000 [Plasmopara halstedii]